MAAQFSALQRGLGAIESVMDIVDQEREVHDLDKSPGGVVAAHRVAGHSLQLPQRPDVPVLQGFSMRVEPGQQSLVGSSGAGKSTVASSFCVFIRPTGTFTSATRTWPPWTCAVPPTRGVCAARGRFCSGET